MITKKFVIAIDGYSSCGKSTFAKAIAEKLNFKYIDSGAMYRAIAYYAYKNNYIDDNNNINIKKLIDDIDLVDIDFIYDPNTKKSVTLLNGENIENFIRNEEIAQLASKLSQIKEIREKMVELQRKIAENSNVVMDGRDIGTVVFPDADIKIFMTADIDTRVKRRYLELLEKGENFSFEELKDLMIKRDKDDETREFSPLCKANDAIILDNTNMTREEQIEWFLCLYETVKRNKNNGKRNNN